MNKHRVAIAIKGKVTGVFEFDVCAPSAEAAIQRANENTFALFHPAVMQTSAVVEIKYIGDSSHA